MKVCSYTHDPLLTLIYLEKETIELFGEDFFQEYSIDIPDVLATELSRTYKRLLELSRELDSLISKRKQNDT